VKDVREQTPTGARNLDAIRRGTCRIRQGYLSATPTHFTGHPDRPERLAGITAAHAGPAEPLPRHLRTTAFGLPHQRPNCPQQTPALGNRSPGNPFGMMRRRRSDAQDLPHQPAELPEQMVGPTSP
jgi:hypothetical protein